MGPAAVHRKSRRIQSGLRKEIRTDQSGDPGQPIPLSQIGATPFDDRDAVGPATMSAVAVA